jgi:hypothetical protein
VSLHQRNIAPFPSFFVGSCTFTAINIKDLGKTDSIGHPFKSSKDKKVIMLKYIVTVIDKNLINQLMFV